MIKLIKFVLSYLLALAIAVLISAMAVDALEQEMTGRCTDCWVLGPYFEGRGQ